MKTIGITCNARNNKLNKHIHISNNINIFHKSYQYYKNTNSLFGNRVRLSFPHLNICIHIN
jgi:hypothetical protein